jgi:hypothetical protein
MTRPRSAVLYYLLVGLGIFVLCALADLAVEFLRRVL